MKQIIIISAIFFLVAAGSVAAEDMFHDTHGAAVGETGHEGGPKGHDAMDHSSHKGENIHTGIVDGYRFAYHLIDIREKMAAMKAAGHAHDGMDATHHLMVYIEAPDGASVDGARVGFLVKGEDATVQKLMAMEMGGGYGSDLKLRGDGKFTIKIKAVVGEVRLIDEFVHRP